MNGSPTIARRTVWLVENRIGGSSLVGFDARTGARRFHSPLFGPAFIAPTIAGNRLYLGTYTGGIQGFALSGTLKVPAGSGENDLVEHSSFSDEAHGWATRENGVFATEDGGKSWRRIYRRSAFRVARISETGGVVALGDRASPCGCGPVRLWTNDGGAHWSRTREAVGEGFVAAGGTLWWWRGGRLYRAVAWPPRTGGMHPRLVSRVVGAFLDADPVPGGVLALATRRVAGLGYDNSPQLILIQGDTERVLELPTVTGDVLVRSLQSSWPVATVRGYDATAFARGEEGPVTWRTLDGGRRWFIERG